MQLKVRVYRGAWFANSDRALMLSTRVYISEQTVGRGFKKSKTTEWTECSTHSALLQCEWRRAEGAVVGV